MVANDMAPLPLISSTVWLTLRQSFQRSLPTRVSLGYLGSVLGYEERSAQAVLRTLIRLGLVQEDGTPTALANEWRSDEGYAAACRQMIEAAYPQELLDIAPPPAADRTAIVSWLMRVRRLGQGAASNQAATYQMIAAGELPGQESPSPRRTNGGGERRSTPRRTIRDSTPDVVAASPDLGAPAPAGRFGAPQLQVAIQVNLDPAMTPEQIDGVFASMARWLYPDGSDSHAA